MSLKIGMGSSTLLLSLNRGTDLELRTKKAGADFYRDQPGLQPLPKGRFPTPRMRLLPKSVAQILGAPALRAAMHEQPAFDSPRHLADHIALHLSKRLIAHPVDKPFIVLIAQQNSPLTSMTATVSAVQFASTMRDSKTCGHAVLLQDVVSPERARANARQFDEQRAADRPLSMDAETLIAHAAGKNAVPIKSLLDLRLFQTTLEEAKQRLESRGAKLRHLRGYMEIRSQQFARTITDASLPPRRPPPGHPQAPGIVIATVNPLQFQDVREALGRENPVVGLFDTTCTQDIVKDNMPETIRLKLASAIGDPDVLKFRGQGPMYPRTLQAEKSESKQESRQPADSQVPAKTSQRDAPAKLSFLEMLQEKRDRGARFKQASRATSHLVHAYRELTGCWPAAPERPARSDLRALPIKRVRGAAMQNPESSRSPTVVHTGSSANRTSVAGDLGFTDLDYLEQATARFIALEPPGVAADTEPARASSELSASTCSTCSSQSSLEQPPGRELPQPPRKVPQAPARTIANRASVLPKGNARISAEPQRVTPLSLQPSQGKRRGQPILPLVIEPRTSSLSHLESFVRTAKRPPPKSE